MKPAPSSPTPIDAYIATCEAAVQPVLRTLRDRIKEVAPAAEEIISYRMPAFRQGGMLVYFAAWQKHIGLYPPIRDNPALELAVQPYAGPKGNLQFPLDQPLPYDLIQRIVAHRLAQLSAKPRRKQK